MPEHIIDDEGVDDPGLRTWFDEMRDRHNAEEKAEEAEPQENSQAHLISQGEAAPNAPDRN